MIIVSLGLLVIPVNLLRRSIRDLQTGRPDAELMAQVEAVVENVRTAEGLPEPILRVGRLGPVLDVALAFVLQPGTGDIACEDRVRRGVRDGLGDLPYTMWITVGFGYDAELFELGPDRDRPVAPSHFTGLHSCPRALGKQTASHLLSGVPGYEGDPASTPINRRRLPRVRRPDRRGIS